jgi:hypothetical protein
MIKGINKPVLLREDKKDGGEGLQAGGAAAGRQVYTVDFFWLFCIFVAESVLPFLSLRSGTQGTVSGRRDRSTFSV